MVELTKAEERLRLRLQLAKNKEYLDINDVVLLSGCLLYTSDAADE